jgi:hypothetical protein
MNGMYQVSYVGSFVDIPLGCPFLILCMDGEFEIR